MQGREAELGVLAPAAVGQGSSCDERSSWGGTVGDGGRCRSVSGRCKVAPPEKVCKQAFVFKSVSHLKIWMFKCPLCSRPSRRIPVQECF